MNKNIKRILGIGLIFALTAILVGCNWGKKEDETDKTKIETKSSNTMYSIADIKNEYAKLGVSENYSFRPFYNVEQTTEFTFHFNSSVDPVKAITVHTDSKCEENSTVYQLNDGYRMQNGVDVVVKPYQSVLNNLSLGKKEAIWGYAPMYYLCIHYDLDSSTVKKLDQPIIIPFTIKNKISTPNVYRYISNDGILSIKWFPVEGAKSYKIYRTDATTYGKMGLTAEETACTNPITLVETLDSSKLEYIPYRDGADKENIRKNGEYVSYQNYESRYAYFVTAVDVNGNESFFSKSAGFYGEERSTLPYTLKYSAFKIGEDKYYIEEFPDTVEVTQCDEKTVIDYPINFYKLKANYTNTVCEYRYEVVGTRLTGTVQYHNEQGEFPEEVKSKAQLNRGGLFEATMPTIPTVDVDTFAGDEEYKNAHIDLASKNSYPQEAKIQLDVASLYRRTELELTRTMSGGTYTKSLDTISSYVANDNPEYVVVKYPNGTIEVKKNDGTTSSTTSTPPTPETNEVNEKEDVTSTTTTESQVTTVPETAETEKPTSVPEVVTPPQKEESNTSSTEVPTEINNNNYVDEQRRSTEKNVEEANKEKVEGTEYPIVAQTAGQKYLALSLIHQEESISLKAFPEYQNVEELLDDLAYVWYQNPYIMGVNIPDSMLSEDNTILYPKYNVDKTTAEKYQKEVFDKAKSVANSITKSGMSDAEKATAIFSYLEKNAKYNEPALAYTGNPSEAYRRYPNSWNTYGILCEGLGVCQSYAYAFNAIAMNMGLTSVMVTGDMDSGGHAWNAVKLNGKWYMIDTTNNASSTGIPYWICNASTEFINKNGFVLDDLFVDGTNISEYKINDDIKDWYYENGLMANTPEDCAKIFLLHKDNPEGVFIKYRIDNQSDFEKRFGNAVMSKLTESELNSLRYASDMGITYLKFAK